MQPDREALDEVLVGVQLVIAEPRQDSVQDLVNEDLPSHNPSRTPIRRLDGMQQPFSPGSTSPSATVYGMPSTHISIGVDVSISSPYPHEKGPSWGQLINNVSRPCYAGIFLTGYGRGAMNNSKLFLARSGALSVRKYSFFSLSKYHQSRFERQYKLSWLQLNLSQKPIWNPHCLGKCVSGWVRLPR